MTTMTMILIRQAGPFKIETDGDRYYCNGKQAFPVYPDAGSNLALMLDTGTKGSNGKRNLVGLQAEHVAIHKRASEAGKQRRAALPTNVRIALVDKVNALIDRDCAAQQSAVDALQAGRGITVKRLDAEIAAAKQAVVDFDAAHPDIAAAAANDRAQRNAELVAAGLSH